MAANNKEYSKQTNNLVPFRWKPGQSGNPNGRPKRKPITDAYKEVLQYTDKAGKTAALALAEAILLKALTGDVGAAKEIADRVEGTVKQAFDILFGDLTDEQLKEYISAQYGTVGVSDIGSAAPGNQPAGDRPGADDAPDASTPVQPGGESTDVV